MTLNLLVFHRESVQNGQFIFTQNELEFIWMSIQESKLLFDFGRLFKKKVQWLSEQVWLMLVFKIKKFSGLWFVCHDIIPTMPCINNLCSLKYFYTMVFAFYLYHSISVNKALITIYLSLPSHYVAKLMFSDLQNP